LTIAFYFDKYWELDEKGCWIWQRKVDQFLHNGELVTARRFAYEREYGELDEGYMVRNSCENLLCVNPEHQHCV